MEERKNLNLINYEATISTNKIAKKDINQENKLKEQNKKVFEHFPQLAKNPALSETEPAHFKLYIADISALSGISKTAEKLLQVILNQGDLVGFKGTFPINTDIKKVLSEGMDLTCKKFSGLNKALIELQEKNEFLDNTPILLKIEKHKYDSKDTKRFMINPYLIASGSWDNILNKRLRVTLDYDFSLNSRKLTIEDLDKSDIKKNINEEETWLDKKPDYSDFDDEVNF